MTETRGRKLRDRNYFSPISVVNSIDFQVRFLFSSVCVANFRRHDHYRRQPAPPPPPPPPPLPPPQTHFSAFDFSRLLDPRLYPTTNKCGSSRGFRVTEDENVLLQLGTRQRNQETAVMELPPPSFFTPPPPPFPRLLGPPDPQSPSIPFPPTSRNLFLFQ